MKPPRYLASALLAACLSAATSAPLWAQDANLQPPPPMGGHPPGDHGRPHHPPPPLMEALDTDHDGVLSANEIANAAASLKKMDKNGDGKLTEDETRPAPPAGGPGGPPSPQGRSGPGDQGGKGDDLKGPDGAAGPAAPNGPGPRPMHRRSPGPDGSDDQAPGSPRAQRPPLPHLADDPVAGRLSSSGSGADQKPASPRVQVGALFDLMDTNHDGVVSEEEKRAALKAVEGLNRGSDGLDGARPQPSPGGGE